MEVVNSKPLETPDPLINHNCLGRLERSITFVVPEIGSGNMMNFLAGSGTSPLVRLENALALHSRTISTKKHRFLNFEASHGRTKSCTTCHVNKFHFKPPSNPACDLLTGLVKKPQRLAAWRIVSGAGICSG